jgi:hypothetical protein
MAAFREPRRYSRADPPAADHFHALEHERTTFRTRSTASFR